MKIRLSYLGIYPVRLTVRIFTAVESRPGWYDVARVRLARESAFDVKRSNVQNNSILCAVYGMSSCKAVERSTGRVAWQVARRQGLRGYRGRSHRLNLDDSGVCSKKRAVDRSELSQCIYLFSSRFLCMFLHIISIYCFAHERKVYLTLSFLIPEGTLSIYKTERAWSTCVFLFYIQGF